MTNLVSRLRGEYSVGPDNVYGTRDFSEFIPAISLEAATRIEELESALKGVMKHIEFSNPTGYRMSGAWNIADRGLRGD